MKDKDWDVRGEAAGALGDMGEPAVQPLIEALKNKSGDIRWGATAVLGYIGDKRAIEPLTKSLKDKNSNVQDEAQRVINAIKKKQAQR